ncbi:hypothetical protein KIW84_010357 [Lathyrus oleraceus]|uniref:Phospholipid-transporting ATPase n=1 Tax=Pisum sativum TaxID=3888 RepID=A0A9D4YKN9_PEA|nr:hypothetical protein KIW84_010357 [Pisum sativum]
MVTSFWQPVTAFCENHNSEHEYTSIKRIYEFFLALATCNTIVPLVVDTPDPDVKLLDYQGESPDEQALAYAAAAYGFMLIERTSGHIVIDIHGERLKFNVLGLHEFDSDRKRMSVILGYPDNSVKLFVKGADTTMFSIIDKSYNMDLIKSTETHLHSYSSLGLRTLVIGMRELNTSEFEQWHTSYEAASTAVFGRAAMLRKISNHVENNVCILGASAIEDKLQHGVPEAIESLRTAGIKVWVLTGDKQETAVSIGFSSKLLTRSMTQIIISSNNKASSRKSLKDALERSRKLDAVSMQIALIIDGGSLVHILDTDHEEELFQLASLCSVVLCCRVAPLQKAGIVSLVKKRTSDMTLAIGDGANDVSMIQMADVGVGISGQEGRQAVMSSDFAMGQFRFLVPLLLVHGHWNYQRLGYMILYNFYRNAVLVLVLFSITVLHIKNSTERRNLGYFSCGTGNPIDDCWRCDPNWQQNRKRLADCGIGFGRNAIGGRDGKFYVVTDPRDDDPVNPRPGTLRHAVIQDRPLWIVFKRDMVIQLKQELIMNSFKTINGRGANVHIANGVCITIQYVTNVIIHGLHIHDCVPTGNAMASPSHIARLVMQFLIVYSALPTIIVGILDKDLGRSTLLRHPQLYSAGQRNEAYNKKLFMLTMADTLWQSMVIFWPPLFAYWKSTIDVASIGDLWTLAVVILVNLHLAMDVVRWYWVTHAVIWGSIAATFIVVMIIDAIPKLPGFWAFFHVANTGLFWALLLGIIVAALLPRLVVKFIYQYYFPSDIQISKGLPINITFLSILLS